MSVTIQVESDSYVLADGEEFSFGRSRQCTRCLDPEDAAISRMAGLILSIQGTWLVENLSSACSLDVVEQHGIRNVLAPGRRYTLDGRMRILVQGSRPKPHVLQVHAPELGKRGDTLPAGEPTAIGQNVTITPQDRLAMVALFAGYLEVGERYDPHPRSYEAAAMRLGCPRTTVVRRIEYLRTRLDNAGVPNMTGPNALRNLAEYALTRALITREDLRLLPGR
jgi:hypothetical protein